jgi:hypothetical protein
MFIRNDLQGDDGTYIRIRQPMKRTGGQNAASSGQVALELEGPQDGGRQARLARLNSFGGTCAQRRKA